ncbi:MAG: ribonuclease HII [Thermoprotei archaeon]
MIIGCDEAGRGPLIGPMVVACVGFERDLLGSLEEIGVTDSKQLTPQRRSELFPRIVQASKAVAVTFVPPEIIDKQNLNSLTYQILEGMVSSLNSIERAEAVFVDKVGSASPLVTYLRFWLGIPEVVIEEKADAKYVVVGAASIVAKVLRDAVIEELKVKYGDFGSGYPSDERTRQWVVDYFRSNGYLPPIVRKSWKSLKDLVPAEYKKKG